MTLFALVAAGQEALAAAPVELRATFDAADSLGGWAVTGEAALDKSKNREGQGGGALKVGPNAKAVWKLRDADASGQVEMWVYEDGTAPAEATAYRVGPRWGLMQGDGRVLVVGALYAPYLAGSTTYAASDSDQKSWFSVQYLAVTRAKGWHKWTFNFGADKGLSISYDGKDVNAAQPRFDWNKTEIKGFNGVVVFGDNGQGSEQTIWVDDVSAALGGPMKAAPAPPPPPPPVVPEKDPPVDRRVELLPAVQGKHPRLLFTAADVERLKQVAAGEGKMFFDKLVGYLGPSSAVPQKPDFLNNGTNAQREGLWRLPTVALHYVLTGDKRSLESTVGHMRFLAGLENWETGQERDSGMGAANVMVGAALAYDWTYNDLEPEFRETFRKKLLLQARRMYYGGHLQKLEGTHYWQQDPQNNHRYHRDGGLVLSALAIADGQPDAEWLLAKVLEELQFVHQWLPADGTCHEGPSYMPFGYLYLTLFSDAADRCLGTRFLDNAFFKSAALFRIESLAPGLAKVLPFGDSGLEPHYYNNYIFRLTARHRLKDVQAAALQMNQANPDACLYGWMSLVWFDPTVSGGSIDNLPKAALYDDLGLVYARDGWQEKNVALMFKCGPYGGYKLNQYRNSNDMHYVNVAHDDPDANMFIIWTGGKLVVAADDYSSKKLTSSHNTILVNGQGQKGEGQGWTQPLRDKDADMTKLAHLLGWKDAGDVVVAEGEAAGAYNDLQRFRRTVVWSKGRYVLVLDDIAAGKPVDITWLLQSPAVGIADAAQRRYVLKDGAVSCEAQLAADAPFEAQVGKSTADVEGKSLDLQQLQVKARTARWRVAALFDPWHKGQLTVALKPVNESTAAVTVAGPGFEDSWTWQAAPDNQTPSALEGKLQGDRSVTFGPGDRAPLPL
jgi:hypothetical protein